MVIGREAGNLEGATTEMLLVFYGCSYSKSLRGALHNASQQQSARCCAEHLNLSSGLYGFAKAVCGAMPCERLKRSAGFSTTYQENTARGIVARRAKNANDHPFNEALKK